MIDGDEATGNCPTAAILGYILTEFGLINLELYPTIHLFAPQCMMCLRIKAV